MLRILPPTCVWECTHLEEVCAGAIRATARTISIRASWRPHLQHKFLLKPSTWRFGMVVLARRKECSASPLPAVGKSEANQLHPMPPMQRGSHALPLLVAVPQLPVLPHRWISSPLASDAANKLSVSEPDPTSCPPDRCVSPCGEKSGGRSSRTGNGCRMLRVSDALTVDACDPRSGARDHERARTGHLRHPAEFLESG